MYVQGCVWIKEERRREEYKEEVMHECAEFCIKKKKIVFIYMNVCIYRYAYL
jgi:hypothetical protein